MSSFKYTEVILIRHGQSLGNARRLYLGHTDLDLSFEGYAQAERAADALVDLEIDHVYSSSLLRAYNTALPHAVRRGLTVIPSDGMKEIFLGEWEGQPIDLLKEKWHDEYEGGWKCNFGVYCPPSGESVPHLAERIYGEVLRIAELHPHSRVLIASHAAAIRSFWGKVAGIEPSKLAELIPFPKNASFTTVRVLDGKIYPVSYSVGGE